MAEISGTEAETTPVARSPIHQLDPVTQLAEWQVSRASSDAPLRLVDLTPLSKVLVRAVPTSAAAGILKCAFGSSRRGADGDLIVGAGPDEWLVLAPAGSKPPITARLVRGKDEFVTVLDVTHGRVLLRLTGAQSAKTLEKLCAIDFSEQTTPDGAAFRSSVARVSCLIVRHDAAEVRSYLICSDRSSGQYLFDALRDAGAEFSLGVDGFQNGEI